ncbi:hypothetical protein SASPL_120305 [Salvia splendens]|uniref:AAA+ ATPase domain-containing protein n=1 Tax=Salvia splendens TaxID=180675 RepID=A0A8X8ZVH3_SALSN|nr:hypothetical protein SASPL_120305 [Salvia splendens]
MAVSAVEVRYKELRVEAECEFVKGKPLPTLWNSLTLIAQGGFNGIFEKDMIMIFSALVRLEILMKLAKREKEENIVPDPNVTFMKGISVEREKTSLQTDYILKILGLDICADTLVGDAMRRGISGGQKKRLTLGDSRWYYAGEMLVGPTNVFFMDEISYGLDSSTAFQIVSFLQQLCHATDATIIVSLLQPAPEIYDLFDDIIFMAEGKIVYQGPRDEVLEFFDTCGFKCPARKEVACFLQEARARYLFLIFESDNINIFTLDSRKFKESRHGCKLTEELSAPSDKSKSQNESFNFKAPGVLTALAGVSGAGKTTLLDVLAALVVGVAGVDGLSTEQRKRLTIAVELVANPSIIFMDEPTTGRDARAAAIVMRAVKNVADTGRTIVCTIHQPSIDIFEAFDEVSIAIYNLLYLLLLKAGGCMIYCGPMGYCSSKVIEYFEGISGVPKIKDGCNPATRILEVTSASSEAELGVDFGQIYIGSTLHEDNKALVKRLGMPASGSKDLHFSTRYAQNGWGHSQPASGSSTGLTGEVHLGYINRERTVFYRERFAGMYASWAYSAAQVIVEIPYVFVQVLVFTMITYPLIGYQFSAYKVYCMFCTLLSYTYLGMLLIAITPSFPVAATLQSAFYTTFNLFAGFFIPRPQIPKWWIWLYYVVPTSWSLKGVVTSQYGDVEKEIAVFGERKTVAGFLTQYFGFQHNMLPLDLGYSSLRLVILFSLLFSLLIALGSLTTKEGEVKIHVLFYLKWKDYIYYYIITSTPELVQNMYYNYLTFYA